VAERDDDRDDELESVLALIGDQHAQVIGPVRAGIHGPILNPVSLSTAT
jgi:hypothetical protein